VSRWHAQKRRERNPPGSVSKRQSDYGYAGEDEDEEVNMSHTLTDDEYDATVELHYHVQEMFEKQNTIIDMDLKDEIIYLRYNGDRQEVEHIVKYAQAVEAFLGYAANYPDRLARTLALLKGVEGVVVPEA
jgi:hypothetical protein